MSFPLVPALLNPHEDNIPILMAITVLEAHYFLGLCVTYGMEWLGFRDFFFFQKCQADKHLKFQHSCSEWFPYCYNHTEKSQLE